MRRRTSPARRGLGRSEEGSVLVLTAAAMVALLAATSLSVDLGRVSVEKRSLQAVADAAASDARYALGQATPCASALSLATDSLKRNDPLAGSDTMSVVLGTTTILNSAEMFQPDAASCPSDPAAGQATAVEVTVSSAVSFLFAAGSRTTSATAFAGGTGTFAGIGIGSSLASVDSNNSPILNGLLTGLLGNNGAVSLSVLSYQGLLDTNVTLGELAATLTGGSVSSLLSTQLTYGQLLAATATILGSSPEAATLNTLIGSLSSSVANFGLNLGQLINIAAPAPPAAANVGINVFNLVTGGAAIANGSNFISIPNLGVSLPGVASVGASVKVIEGPQVAFGDPTAGPVKASTSQVDVTLTAVVPINVLGVVTGSLSVPLRYTMAQGTATLATPFDCSGANPPPDSINVNTAGATLSLSAPPPAPGPPPPVAATLGQLDANVLGLQVPVLSLSGQASLGVLGASNGQAAFSGPFSTTQTFAGYPVRQTNGTQVVPGQVQVSSTLQASDLTATALGVLPLPLGTIVDAVTTTLDPIINSLTTTVLTPITEALGVDLAGATVASLAPTTCTGSASSALLG